MWRASYLLLLLTALLALAAGMGCGGRDKRDTETKEAPRQSATLKAPLLASPAPPPGQDLITRQQAFITARGFYPGEPTTAPGLDGRWLIAYPSICASSVAVNHRNCQVVHFFLDETYLGTDTAYAYYGYETVTAGPNHVTVKYTTYSPNEPECCPTVTETVVYVWTGDSLEASREPPRPRGEPFGTYRQLASERSPLYIVAYATACAPASLTVPSGQALDITFVNASGQPQALRIVDAGLQIETSIIASGAVAALEATFANPGMPTFDCGSGQGEFRVVAPLPDN